MAGQLYPSKSSNLLDAVTMTFPKKQHDLAFNNEDFSDVTLVSNDNQKFYALWNLLQRRWLWLASRKNVELARNVKEGDDHQIRIDISGKMLLLILKWVYYDTIDLTGWAIDDLIFLIEKCQLVKLPEVEESVSDHIKKTVTDEKIELSHIGRVFEHADKLKDTELMNKMVDIAVQKVEDVVQYAEHFPLKLIVGIVETIDESKYPTFFMSLKKWSSRRSEEQLNVVMSKVIWSAVPNEVISAFASHTDAWKSVKLVKELKFWGISKKMPDTKEAPKVIVDKEAPKVIVDKGVPKVIVDKEAPKVIVEKEAPKVLVDKEAPKVVLNMEDQQVQIGSKQYNLKVDDVAKFYNERFSSVPAPSSLFSSEDDFYETGGCFLLDLKREVEGNTVTWRCKLGSVNSVYVDGCATFRAPGNDVNFVTFPVKSIKSIQIYSTKPALINSLVVCVRPDETPIKMGALHSRIPPGSWRRVQQN